MLKHKQFYLFVILFYRRMESQINAEALADDNHGLNKVNAGNLIHLLLDGHSTISQYTYIKIYILLYLKINV